MKRVFANIGFSVAVALVVLNFMNVKAALAALVASGVAFIVSVAVPKIRSGKAFSLCLLGVCFACALFASFYYGTYLPQTKLFGKTASVRAYIVDLPQKTSSGKYLYTVKTQSISGSDVPQNIKFEMYSESPVYAEAYDVLDMRVSLIPLPITPMIQWADLTIIFSFAAIFLIVQKRARLLKAQTNPLSNCAQN